MDAVQHSTHCMALGSFLQYLLVSICLMDMYVVEKEN